MRIPVADKGVRLDSACNSPGSPSTSTIYITVPATLITETVYPSSQETPATDATVTNSFASTQIISVEEPSPGPYSFTEDNGTTSWMGGRTPPASAQLITSTSFITLHPVSTVISDPSQETTTVMTAMSYSTVIPADKVTSTFTKSLVYYVPSVSASAKGYSAYSSAGWNASLTTFLKLKIAPTTSPGSASSVQESSMSNFVADDITAYVTPTAYGIPPRHRIKARQVGAAVVAKIDGEAVSWTNSFDGSSQTIPDEVPSFVPVTATAPSFGGAVPCRSSISHMQHSQELMHRTASSSSYSSPVQISSSSVSIPSTTVAAYPWDLNPTSSPLSKVSSTSSVSTWTYLQPGLYPVPTISAFSPSSLTQPATRTLELTSIIGTAAATTATSSCIESSAMFTVDFDDLPSFSAGPDDTDIPPIFNPYRKLYWVSHFIFSLSFLVLNQVNCKTFLTSTCAQSYSTDPFASKRENTTDSGKLFRTGTLAMFRRQQIHSHLIHLPSLQCTVGVVWMSLDQVTLALNQTGNLAQDLEQKTTPTGSMFFQPILDVPTVDQPTASSLLLPTPFKGPSLRPSRSRRVQD